MSTLGTLGRRIYGNNNGMSMKIQWSKFKNARTPKRYGKVPKNKKKYAICCAVNVINQCIIMHAVPSLKWMENVKCKSQQQMSKFSIPIITLTKEFPT